MPVRICWYMWLDCVSRSRDVGPRSLLIDMQVSWSVESPANVVATRLVYDYGPMESIQCDVLPVVFTDCVSTHSSIVSCCKYDF